MSEFKVNTITNRDGSYGPQVCGITTFGSSGMQLPSGPTEFRGGRGRAIFFGGSPADPDTMTSVEIATVSNGTDFGNLANDLGNCKGCASSTRGLIMGGGIPSVVNIIQGVTLSSSGDVFNFGDLTEARNDNQCVANNVRGLACGGSAPLKKSQIEFVTIASVGDGSNFGDLTIERSMGGGSGDSTRGIIMGGGSGNPSTTKENSIDFITIATLGDAQDFGDLANEARTRTANLSSSTRAVVAGGYTTDPNGDTTHIDFVTIQTKSNATDFGDLTSGKEGMGGASSEIRGLFAGGTGTINTIDYITIATAGNAADFGDMHTQRKNFGGFSDSHGGLTQ